ncbi:MAG: hypothetical protein ACPL0A_01410 [Candidatus Micrarchaeia archaeon]
MLDFEIWPKLEMLVIGKKDDIEVALYRRGKIIIKNVKERNDQFPAFTHSAFLWGLASPPVLQAGCRSPRLSPPPNYKLKILSDFVMPCRPSLRSGPIITIKRKILAGFYPNFPSENFS